MTRSSILFCCVFALGVHGADDALLPIPGSAQLVLSENWADGKIDRAKWYVPRKKWGQGNQGVTPDNVRVEPDTVAGAAQHVLVCEAHGDLYDGPVAGYDGVNTRVGGMIVSKTFFASGRFEVVMKVGTSEQPMPAGCIPAIWTYAYRYVEVDRSRMTEFVADAPLYNPNMPRYGAGINEYWSEIDFPELGKNGDFKHGLYNTFLQNREDLKVFPIGGVIDGAYHTYTTEWRTKLQPLPGVTDNQVVEKDGFCWIKDKTIAFQKYLGNPLKRIAKDDYAIYSGDIVTHWIDGKKIGENKKYVPAMAAQLTLGVWLPKWAGPAAWKSSRASFASIKAWQYNDPGDVRGVLTEDLKDTFDQKGKPVPK